MREEILESVLRYAEAEWPSVEFEPSESPVPVAGRVFDGEDVCHAVDAALDFWLTTGRFAEQFERDLARLIGVRSVSLCNSGSSANLLAIAALTSPALGERQVRPGDEVITVAAGFPTTVNAIIQNRLKPVFVDVELGTYNVDTSYLEEAISHRTKAIALASRPQSRSSISTVSEAAPNRPPSMAATAACASSAVAGTTTPFPAASPSALMTGGRSNEST